MNRDNLLREMYRPNAPKVDMTWLIIILYNKIHMIDK